MIRFLSNASLALPSTECIVVIAIFLVPLSALPSMERLKFTSFASVTLQGVIVACVALAAVSSNIQARSPNTHLIVNPVQPIPMISYDPLAWMRSAPIVAFAYQFHQNAPFLLAELRRLPSDSKYPTKRAKLQVASARPPLVGVASPPPPVLGSPKLSSTFRL